ncbi:transcriptional regulator [Sporosarcina luteola]|uniref:Transcriptional regulator n=1 Tax=Sporosarcina luteola TaxID=582850 RepID=A0A511ZCJ0_9BACL|nr:helix-turn-helix transcriptional regulator [Sporosarcina luteola]GEN85158.1 transcriptional regulator [Sporosarcina luteola]
MLLAGYLIKKERIKRNMKQIWLAKNICTVSYLSKIENGQTTASQEILSLLAKRLDIVTDSFNSHTEDSFITSLTTFYKEYLTNKNNDGLQEIINTRNNKYVFKCRRNYHTYSLLLTRFLLISNEDMSMIKSEIEFSELLLHEYSTKEKYLHYLNTCLYKYFDNDFLSAFDYIIKIENIFNELGLEPWERADFNYIASLCYSKIHFFNKAVDFAGQALEYFTNNLFLERALDCHIIMGNSYKNLADYHNADRHLKFALEITNLLNKRDYLGMLYHNLALLHSRKGFSHIAIEYFKKCLEYKEERELKSFLLTIYALIKVLYRNRQYEEAKEYCQQGLLLINQCEMKELYEEYTNHFTIYTYYIDGNENIKQALNTAVDYFGEVNDNWNKGKYTLALAEHYQSIGHYKKSALYYSEFVKAQLEKQSITSWEDL